jgi:hypothetical protein
VHRAATETGGIWKLVRWAKERSHLPPEQPIIPTLQIKKGDRQAETPQEKAQLLRECFFPEEPIADLSDLEGCRYLQAVEPLLQIVPEDVPEIMDRRLSYSVPGPDRIPNEFLKALGETFAKAMAALTQACWNAGHYPERFHKTRTAALRKPRKDDYASPGA